MSDLRELYQELIMDHNKRPRNFGSMEDADQTAEGHNPLCGDHVTVFLKLNGSVIQDIRFSGDGCAISRASASLMTAALKGKTVAEALQIFDTFHRMVAGSNFPPEEELEGLGKLAVFSGVREFPVRVKCASLAWHTLRAALEQAGQPVTTE